MTEALQQLPLTEWAVHYVMVLLRVTGLFVFLPIFGSELLPVRIRLGIASVLAVAFFPVAPVAGLSPGDLTGWATLGIRELLAGLGFGLAARMIFAGLETAAGLVAGQSGFALASMVDPVSGDQAMTPALFQNLLAMALFLAADLHHLLIRAIVQSYELLPPATALPVFDSLESIAGMLGMRLFTLAVQLAAPALIVTFSVDLVMALVGRAMPQVPIMLVGYPFKLAAGLVGMVLLVTATGRTLGWIGRTVVSDGAAVVSAFAGS